MNFISRKSSLVRFLNLSYDLWEICYEFCRLLQYSILRFFLLLGWGTVEILFHKYIYRFVFRVDNGTLYRPFLYYLLVIFSSFGNCSYLAHSYVLYLISKHFLDNTLFCSIWSQFHCPFSMLPNICLYFVMTFEFWLKLRLIIYVVKFFCFCRDVTKFVNFFIQCGWWSILFCVIPEKTI